MLKHFSLSDEDVSEFRRRATKGAPNRRKTRSSGGARRDRTDDLKLAKLPLSQLSYGPKP